MNDKNYFFIIHFKKDIFSTLHSEKLIFGSGNAFAKNVNFTFAGYGN